MTDIRYGFQILQPTQLVVITQADGPPPPSRLWGVLKKACYGVAGLAVLVAGAFVLHYTGLTGLAGPWGIFVGFVTYMLVADA